MNFNGMDIGDLFRQMHSQTQETTIDYRVDIWTGDAQHEPQYIKTTSFYAKQQFKNLVMQLSQNASPMKCKMSYSSYFEDGEVDKGFIEYTNPAMDRANAEKDI